MNVNKIKRNLLILILLVTNVGCDQISKSIVRQRIDYGEQISLVGNFVILTKVENKGAFLSLGESLPRLMYKLVMIVLPLVVLIYVLYYLFTGSNLTNLLILGFCLIIGGGFGNIYDRILYHSVTDFLHFDFVIFHTGIVNIADISVTAGFFILMYKFFVNRRILNLKTTTKK
jgi:signal peptidase II